MPSTFESLAMEEKSGYDSPATMPYTVDLETSAACAIATTVRSSDVNEASSALATACAALASAGASGASSPVAKDPEASQERGGGALRLVTVPTLPQGEVSDVANTPEVDRVRIIGHNAGMESFPEVPETLSQAAASQAALDALAQIDVPARGAVAFATEIPDPGKGHRRHTYLALEVLKLALACDRPQQELAGVLDGHPRANRRSDRARVQAAVLDVLVRLPAETRVAEEELSAAVTGHVGPGAILVAEAQKYPAVLLRLPEGDRCFAEIHPARRRGGEADAWMNSRITAHLIVGQSIRDFAGVLVFCVRTLSVVHVLSLNHRHAAGDCVVCEQVKS